MYRYILVILVLITASCNNEKKDQPANAIDPSLVKNPISASGNSNSKDNVPVLQFETDTHDFGTIEEGEKISFAFKFKNVGQGDLVIRAAQGSCGCTVPEYPKDPVHPGDNGIINVTFNSEGKEGQQHKTVTVISNTIPNTYTLNILGNVNKKPE
jgi:hypothetical protein